MCAYESAITVCGLDRRCAEVTSASEMLGYHRGFVCMKG